MTVYDVTVKTLTGEEVSLGQYRGKVLLIVNTASKCGFTPQYKELQELYEKYAAQGLEILGFPSNQFAEQEPGDHEEIRNFCQLNYGVTFPLLAKNDVRGENAQPLFQYLAESTVFKGFDQAHPITARLESALQTRFPEYLEGNGIKWNFTKFLIDRQGEIVGRFEPTTSPLAMEEEIKRLVQEEK